MSEDFDKDQHELLDAWVTTPTSTDTDLENPRRSSTPQPIDIAIALRGNLPKPAFAWPSQYVKKLAPEGGSALVSLVDGMLKIMYFPGSDQPDSAGLEPEDRIESGLLSDHAESLDDVIGFLVTHVRNLVIIPDYRESYSSIIAHELPLLLFTAADPLAIEAAYSLLTRPVDSASALQLPMPQVDLVFFGSPAYEAEIAADRISKTARKCMQIDVAWKGYALRRMDPHVNYEDVDVHVGSPYGVADFIKHVERQQGAADEFLSTSKLVDLLEQSSNPDRTESSKAEAFASNRYPQHDPVEIEPSGPDIADGRGMGAEQDLEITISKDERAMLEELVELPSETRTSEAIPGKPDPGRATDSEPSSGESGRGVLLQLFPDLRPLTQRIPIDPDIECGLDEANRLHLLAGEGSLRELQSAALEIRRWEDMVVGSLELMPFDQGGLQLDLVVNDPAGNSDLHGTGLNLHYLLPVPDGARRVVALNNERTARSR